MHKIAPKLLSLSEADFKKECVDTKKFIQCNKQSTEQFQSSNLITPCRKVWWRLFHHSDIVSCLQLQPIFLKTIHWKSSQCTEPYRSSHQRCSVRKGILRNFAKFTGKHLYRSLFFNRVAGLRPATLLRKKIWHKCFPVNFAKFSRTAFFTEHLWWLILSLVWRCMTFQIEQGFNIKF